MNLEPILIRMPNWLGDAVMATPALESLHRTGRFRLHVLIRRPWDGLFRRDPRVSEVIVCDDRAAGLLRLSAELRARNFSTVVDFTHSARSRLVWRLSSIPKLFREDPIRPDVHQSLRYLAVVRDLIGEGPAAPHPPRIIGSDLEQSAGSSQASNEIILFPAAAYGPAKMWSLDGYRALVRNLLDRGHSVHLAGVPSDRPFLEQIQTASIRVSTSLALPDLMRLLQSAAAVISCDSGAAHLAAALGRPVIVLFFSTDPARTAPVGFAARSLAAAVPCRPCFLRTCPIGYLCRDAITPAQVLAHVDDIFDVPVKGSPIRR